MLPTRFHVKKRDGSIAEFEVEKIADAIFKAAQSVGGKDKKTSKELAQKVEEVVRQRFTEGMPHVEDIQDITEEVLIRSAHAKTAKAYILYRHERTSDREKRSLILGEEKAAKIKELNFSHNALKILEQRYLRKSADGTLNETPEDMLRRVSQSLAEVDRQYGGSDQEVQQSADKFYSMMTELQFLPTSPTLMNAGTDVPQLSSCYVLPIYDSMESIYDAIKHAAIIQQRGGGTGFNFSRLRPAGDTVHRKQGVAGGPISFMKVFDSSAEAVLQGGKRSGANMGILRIDHPDILSFIHLKEDKQTLQNFNISVAATNAFMEAVLADEHYDLINPRTGKSVKRLKARNVFNVLLQNAWKTGDPGIVFIDRMNDLHGGRHLGDVESTSPCGEQPMLPYESSPFGSINLKSFVKEDQKIDWKGLEEAVKGAVHFLDNAVDATSYPLEEMEAVCKATRKIGLGIMGFADMLYALRISYDSESGFETAEKVMSFIQKTAHNASQDLAKKRGAYPRWEGSIHQQQGRQMRNSGVTAISPTGTISLLADVSSGCEPNFALSYIKTVMGTEMVYSNPLFERAAKEEEFYSLDLMRRIAQGGSVQRIADIPDAIKRVFVTGMDISPESHVRMQAAFQKYVDGAISKTINFPSSATIDDVENAYLQAYKLGCKGITIYRDQSMSDQVVTIGDEHQPDLCPECDTQLIDKEGCGTCESCGYTSCD